MRRSVDILLFSRCRKLLLVAAAAVFLSCIWGVSNPQPSFAADASPYDELGQPRTEKSFWAKFKDVSRTLSGDSGKNCPPMSTIKERYMGKCYACKVVKTLLETFIKACSKTYSVSREAGIKVLIVGSMIWLMIFGLKNVFKICINFF